MFTVGQVELDAPQIKVISAAFVEEVFAGDVNETIAGFSQHCAVKVLLVEYPPSAN